MANKLCLYRSRCFFAIVVSVLVSFFTPAITQANIPHYDLHLQVHLPDQISYQLRVQHLKQSVYQFQMNPGLRIKTLDPRDELTVTTKDKGIMVKSVDSGDGVLNFQVEGTLLAEGLTDHRAMILTSALQWLPNLAPLFTYQIEVVTDANLHIFSPAREQQPPGGKGKTFSESNPQEDLYLVIGKYFEFTRDLSAKTKVGVLLLADDHQLAESYLDLLPGYLERYEKLFGTYLYPHFYVIENFNETGYGMPGFTLLGPSVVRLPFILKSSLPHEVLHNWWGNGVYVNYQKGNWCEGLTTYFSDHYEQELVGQGETYRRNTLTGYSDFVESTEGAQDFPLIEFRERHSPASQAVGYGKSMMVFHMLKNWLGGEVLEKTLRDFYKKNRHQQVGFEGLMEALGPSVGYELRDFYRPWLTMTGAAQIKVTPRCDLQSKKRIVEIKSTPNSFQFRLPYEIRSNHTPIKEAVRTDRLTDALTISEGHAQLSLPFDFAGEVVFDPHFDVFRTLSEGEKPVSFSRILGADEIKVIVQTGFEDEFKKWQEGLKTSFAGHMDSISIDELRHLESGHQVIMFGHEPPGLLDLQTHFPSAVKNQGNLLVIEEQSYRINEKGWLVMFADMARKNTYAWVSPSSSHDNYTWGRQLTHYSKFGVMVFEGRKNIVKTSYSGGPGTLQIQLNSCSETQ